MDSDYSHPRGVVVFTAFSSDTKDGSRIFHLESELLVSRLRIVLADETTGNRDSGTWVEVMEIFQKLNREGLTIIPVTHKLDIAQFAKTEHRVPRQASSGTL